MHCLALLPVLLAPLASTSPTAARLHARQDGGVTIHASSDFSGQQAVIRVNGICVNLGPPFATSQRGIQSLKFEVPEGQHCQIFRENNCRDYDPVLLFESQQRIRITANSIRCEKNSAINDENE